MMQIYTSIDGFSRKQLDTKSYKMLSERFCEWIEQNTLRLLQKRTVAELKAGELLKKMFATVYEQPFFMINGRSYFLDFFIPEKNMAVEIDGKYHEGRKEIDTLRDSDFKSIGINTIRINASDVLNGKFLDTLRVRHQKSKKIKKASRNLEKPVESKIIRMAIKRLKEHDRMKHHATWI